MFLFYDMAWQENMPTCVLRRGKDFLEQLCESLKICLAKQTQIRAVFRTPLEPGYMAAYIAAEWRPARAGGAHAQYVPVTMMK